MVLVGVVFDHTQQGMQCTLNYELALIIFVTIIQFTPLVPDNNYLHLQRSLTILFTKEYSYTVPRRINYNRFFVTITV